MAASAASANPCCAFYAAQEGCQGRRNVQCQLGPVGGGQRFGNGYGRRQGGCVNGYCQGRRGQQGRRGNGIGRRGNGIGRRGNGIGRRAATASLDENFQCQGNMANCGGGQGWRNGGGSRGRGVAGGRGTNGQGAGCFQGLDPANCGQGWRNGGGGRGVGGGGGAGAGGRWN